MVSTNSHDGFSLIEVLVAIAIIAFGILAFAANTVSLTQGHYISSNYTIALNLAQERMEELKARASSSLNTTGSPECVQADGTVSGSSTCTGSAKFNRSWVVTSNSSGASDTSCLSAGTTTNLTCLRVTVSWTDYRSHSVTLTTFIYVG